MAQKINIVVFLLRFPASEANALTTRPTGMPKPKHIIGRTVHFSRTPICLRKKVTTKKRIYENGDICC